MEQNGAKAVRNGRGGANKKATNGANKILGNLTAVPCQDKASPDREPLFRNFRQVTHRVGRSDGTRPYRERWTGRDRIGLDRRVRCSMYMCVWQQLTRPFSCFKNIYLPRNQERKTFTLTIFFYRGADFGSVCWSIVIAKRLLASRANTNSISDAQDSSYLVFIELLESCPQR